MQVIASKCSGPGYPVASASTDAPTLALTKPVDKTNFPITKRSVIGNNKFNLALLGHDFRQLRLTERSVFSPQPQTGRYL